MKILSNGPGDVYFKEKLCSQSWGEGEVFFHELDTYASASQCLDNPA